MKDQTKLQLHFVSNLNQNLHVIVMALFLKTLRIISTGEAIIIKIIIAIIINASPEEKIILANGQVTKT